MKTEFLVGRIMLGEKVKRLKGEKVRS